MTLRSAFKNYVFVVFMFGFFDKALTAVIQTQQTVLAAVGEDAEFSCQLSETKDVRQVTWQKISADMKKNAATYSQLYGQRVNDGFTDKIEFKSTGLQNCSIVIRNVMEQDEACYHCLFITYPEGSFIGKPCLQVYELHEPVLDVTESNSTAEWVVSCSATGRPAPTVTLSVSQRDLSFSQNNTVIVSNSNATFTVTTTAVLSGSRSNSTQVGCAARVLTAPQREVTVIIPDHHDDDDGLDEKSGSNHRSLGIRISVILSVLLVACGCVAALVFVLLRTIPQSRELQMDETPETASGDTQETQTPSVSQESTEARQETPEGNQQNNDQMLLLGTVRKLSFD